MVRVAIVLSMNDVYLKKDSKKKKKKKNSIEIVTGI